MRRFLIILLSLAAFLAVLLLLSPFWLPWALPAIARPLRASVGSYSRIGYTRFAVENVTLERRTVTVQVQRIEADTPWLWGIRHVLHRDRPIVADKWSVHVHTGGGPHGPRTDEGWVELQAHLSRIANGLERWLRSATIGPGCVDWPRNEIVLQHAVWKHRDLSVEQLAWRTFQGDVDLDFDRGESKWHLKARGIGPGMELHARAEGAKLNGELLFNQQKADFSAEFPETGWMPNSASIEASAWHLASAVTHLRGYSDIDAMVRATWAEERFVIDADASSAPLHGSPYPPLKVAVHAHGDRQSYTIEKMDVSIPGAEAHLDRPIKGKLEQVGELTSAVKSRFTLQTKLSDLPYTKAVGTLQGTVDLEPRAHGWPNFIFNVAGENIIWGKFRAKSALARGSLVWPLLSIETAQLEAGGDSKLVASGRADFGKRQISALKVDGALDASIFQPWLPANVAVTRARLSAQAQGPFESFEQQGHVELDHVRVDGLQPADVHLNWQGHGANVSGYDLSIQAGHTEILAAGNADADQIKFERFVWRHQNADRLTLQSPARFVWRPKLKIEGLDLFGPAGELHLSAAWGETGTVSLFARGIESAWWRDLLPVAPFDWSLDNLFVKANWDRGPISVDTTGQFSVRLADRSPISVLISANANGKSVVLQQLQAREDQVELANFSGELPLQLFASPHPRVAIDKRAPLRVQGKLNQSAPEWTDVAKRFGVTLTQPDVTVALSGSLEALRGSLSFSADELQLGRQFGERTWPKIEHLHAQISATGSKLELESASVLIAGQAVDVSGSLPLGEDVWTKLRKDPLDILRHEGALRLQIPNADLTQIAPLISPLLLPQGHLDADISLSGSAPWQGHLRFHDVATKPISSLGRLRDIHGDIEFENRDVIFNDVRLGFGERPITLAGRIHISDEGAPRIELSATGKDLPFVRQAGLLVRGNVNLKLVSAARKTLRPIIRGDVELTDGLFVSDVRSLIPRGGGSGPALRPPYFSIEAEPFRDWRLDVDVHGEKFLRAKTTVFNGLTSMKFHLEGTLAEPRALGELRIAEGQVLFPFATFSLNDATVRLTDSNPYDPALGLFGKSRRYGYDLSMEITGNASAPVIAFSANPSLTSEQVLLMVMAGEVPKDEINYSTSQKISRLGTFFGQSLLGSLGGGSGQDRLTITTGEEVSITGRETYDVEYALNDRWSVVGEYDEFDDYNAGVKLKILRGHKADETKK